MKMKLFSKFFCFFFFLISLILSNSFSFAKSPEGKNLKKKETSSASALKKKKTSATKETPATLKKKKTSANLTKKNSKSKKSDRKLSSKKENSVQPFSCDLKKPEDSFETYLNFFKSLCDKKNKENKENIAAMRFFDLKDCSDKLANRFLNKPPSSRIYSIAALTEGMTVLENDREDLSCGDIRSEFDFNYSRSLNLGDDATIKDYPEKWVRTILKGLNCVCP